MSSRSRLFRIFLLFSACLAAARATPPVTAHAIDAEFSFGDVALLRVGASRDEVRFLLGDPDLQAGDRWWVYWNFRARPVAANPQGFDALVLNFDGDFVGGMKLADSHAIQRCICPRQPLPLR